MIQLMLMEKSNDTSISTKLKVLNGKTKYYFYISIDIQTL